VQRRRWRWQGLDDDSWYVIFFLLLMFISFFYLFLSYFTNNIDAYGMGTGTTTTPGTTNGHHNGLGWPATT
jgi:hypothetical protein